MHRENLHENCDESDNADNEEQRTLFCANLDEKVTEEVLYELFIQAGPIESVRIPKDHSGKQRTFGFITYVHKSTIPYAMQLFQGLTLYRRTLTIKSQSIPPQTPVRNYITPGYGNKRSTYDNTSLRGSHYTPSNGSPPINPFHKSFPDYPSNSTKHQDNISKHPSSQKRHHTNTSPYQRNSGSSEDRYRDKDHNKRRQYNNESNRHSEQRSGGRNRR